MIRLLADENFHGDILRGLQRVEPKLDLLRVQDTHLYQAADPVVLEWAATEDRILLTHDVQTIGQAIEEILTTLLATQPGELANRITYIPL